jgi:ferredoxin
MTIQKVSIEEGCISCSLCMDIAPDVFDVPDGEDCVILSGAQTHFASKKADILLAAADCPVEVIAVEETEEDDKQVSSGSQ